MWLSVSLSPLPLNLKHAAVSKLLSEWIHPLKKSKYEQ